MAFVDHAQLVYKSNNPNIKILKRNSESIFVLTINQILLSDINDVLNVLKPMSFMTPLSLPKCVQLLNMSPSHNSQVINFEIHISQ